MGTENKSSKKKRRDVSPPSSSQDEGKTKGDYKTEKKKKKSKSVNLLPTEVEKVKFQELSNDDYFAKNNEFSTWLKEEKSLFFSDLSTENAHDLFSQFAKEWNKGKLESRYYEGIVSGPRTSHKWKIK